MLNKRIYTVSISVDLMAIKTHPVSCVIDTGAGRNTIREDFLRAEWLKAIYVNNRPAIMKANDQKVSVVGTATPRLRTGYSGVRVVFCVVQSVAVAVLLGTSYIDMFVEGILRRQRKALPYSSKPVVIRAIKGMPE